MGPDQLGIFWLILSSLSVCALIFGNRYLSNRENMAMIEKGLDPKLKLDRRPAPFRSLKWGLLLVGSGVGLFLAYLMDNFMLFNIHHQANNYDNDANAPIYFALIAIGGGIGLILSYRIEKKELPNR